MKTLSGAIWKKVIVAQPCPACHKWHLWARMDADTLFAFCPLWNATWFCSHVEIPE